MKLALATVAVVIVALVLTVAALRFRKLRRDESRNLGKTPERRLVVPPPSPYAPSKGFRLIDAAGEAINRPPVERPRLDAERPYVFNDSAVADEDFTLSRARHNDEWFLSRSSHRSAGSIMSRRVSIAVLAIVIAAALVAYYVSHQSKTTPKAAASDATTTSGATNATTTTPTTTTTTVVRFPPSFVATSTSGEDAIYSVPAPKYRVMVTGSLGATWAVYDMGPSNRLEWQGTVAKGGDELLTMTGNSRVTIGSPTNATVSIDGRPVTFPTPRPATLILVFNSRALTSAG